MALAADGLPRLRREVAVARWLAEHRFPAVRAADRVQCQPVLVDGYAVSFWEYLPGLTLGTPADIGGMLRRLHRLPTPPDGLFDAHDPFVGQQEHIEAAGLAEEEKRSLSDRLAWLRDEYERVEFLWPVGVVHGDAHRKNVVRDVDGPVLLDLERFGVGHREWDAVVPAVYQRVGWYTAEEYASFVEAYGYDITSWEGFGTLAAIRELRMTTWLAARTRREPRLLPEARERIASLDSDHRDWTPGT